MKEDSRETERIQDDRKMLSLLNLRKWILLLRALALGNANAKSKGNLAFLTWKQSASGNGKQHYCKFFCNSATVQF